MERQTKHHGRFHFQEQIQFCSHPRGSLSEVANHIYTAFDCNYKSKEQVYDLEHKYQLQLKLI